MDRHPRRHLDGDLLRRAQAGRHHARSGDWTSDGYLQGNEDNDGKYWLGPWYAYGSPVTTF